MYTYELEEPRWVWEKRRKLQESQRRKERICLFVGSLATLASVWAILIKIY